jgi:peroxiredoxin
MRTLIGGLLGAALIGLPVSSADTKDENPPDRKAQFKTIQENFGKAQAQGYQALRAAKTPEEQKAASEKMPMTADYVDKLLKLVEADPNDDLSLEMLSWLTLAVHGKDAKVIDLLIRNHVKNPKIASLCESYSFGAPGADKPLLEKVLSDNPDKRAQGLACFALAVLAADAEDPSKTAAEAERLFERCAKEFADVKQGTGTLGDSAKGYLFEIRNLAVGKPAPDLRSKDIDGKEVKLSDYRGKVVVLDLWVEWNGPCCGPSRAMIPHERDMMKKLQGKPFALISVSVDDKDILKEFLKEESIPWTLWCPGSDSTIRKDWHVRFFPSIYVIDAKGVIRYKYIREKELEEAVEKLVAEATEKK